MKRLKLIINLTMTLLLITILAQATGFDTINGLKYLIDTEKNEATLVANDPVYSGDFIVPEKITSYGKDYPVTALGNNCFYNCSGLTSITIPSSVTSFGNNCFYYCGGLTSITIPSSVTSLGSYCFYGCSGLTSITILSSIASLGDYCFYNCNKLTSFTIPSSVTSLGNYCFSSCYRLISITIPSSVTSLGDRCFGSCINLTTLIIPSSVTSLGNSCFYWCYRLTSITIPSSVTSLGSNCFSGCSKLTSIICYANTPPICQSVSEGLCILYVPQASIDQYKAADGWKSFPYILAIEGSEPGGDSTKCNVPSITFIDGKLHFSSTTQGVEYHYTITDKDIASNNYSQSGEVALSATYEISAYATADGHMASDSATATLYWLPTSEVNNINSTATHGIVASCNNGIITISGLNTQENVTFYTVNGEQLGTAAAVNSIASFAVNATNDIVIAKFGDSSIKIATK